jgi:hypothetical protein
MIFSLCLFPPCLPIKQDEIDSWYNYKEKVRPWFFGGLVDDISSLVICSFIVLFHYIYLFLTSCRMDNIRSVDSQGARNQTIILDKLACLK